MKIKGIMKFAKNKYFIGLVVLVLLIISWQVYKKITAPPNFDSAAAQMGNVKEVVSATGTVSPVGKAELAFESSGLISKINVSVGNHVSKGDIIATLDSSGIVANLDKAQAGLSGEEAKLNQYQNTSGAGTTQIDTAKRKLVDSILDAYRVADDAIRNKTDQFFTDPTTMNPKIVFAFNDYDLKEKINTNRIVIEETLAKWQKMNTQITYSNVTDTNADNARTYLTTIKMFLDNIALAVNAFETNNTLPQGTIDKYKGDVSLARANIDNSLSSLTSAQESARLTYSSIPIQEASVNSAKSDVSYYQTQINKTILRSPINGVVTKVVPNLGEFVSAGQTVFGVISDKDFKVEAYVPEADIAKISVGNLSTTTLDAYGSGTYFQTEVITIDPAETVIEGVPTYKVTLVFVNADSRVRSGMTANLDILTREVNNVIEIPYRAVTDENGSKTVRVVNSDGKTYKSVPVTLGIRGFDGTVEIKSGLNKGDKVVTYVK